MPLQLDHLDLLGDGATTAAAGAPLQLALEDIDEDPRQPRREFDADAPAAPATADSSG